MKSNQKVVSPLITVAMPIYNAGEYLHAAVKSIIMQTYTNWELLIIDDGSTDNAIDSIKLIKDERIKILKDGLNKGLAARLNQAIDLAKGQYFARMDQDDISMPERFKLQIEALKSDLELDLVAGRVLTINGKNQIVGQLPFAHNYEQICAKPWMGFYMPHPAWFGRIEWFRKHRYALPAPYLCEDQELLLRTYKVSKFKCLDQILLHYRVRDKISLLKAVKTRWTVLKCQLNAFNRNEIVFNGLAMTVFVLKILKDIFKKMTEFIR
jgi:glycosyltransferase involved in cell wall biosynthesis